MNSILNRLKNLHDKILLSNNKLQNDIESYLSSLQTVIQPSSTIQIPKYCYPLPKTQTKDIFLLKKSTYSKELTTNSSHTLSPTTKQPFQLQNETQKSTNDSNSNNNNFLSKKIKLIKNNKSVYVPLSSSKQYHNQRKKTAEKSEVLINRGLRGSVFRGVSRNGNLWQVLIMIKKKKTYIGSYSQEQIAARVYDIVAVKNYGMKAKTNFDYNDEQMQSMKGINVKASDILSKIEEISLP